MARCDHHVWAGEGGALVKRKCEVGAGHEYHSFEPHVCECVCASLLREELQERKDSAWHETERDEILDGQEKDRKMGME